MTMSIADATSPRAAVDVAARALLLSARQVAATKAAAMATRLEVHVLPAPPAAGHSIFDFGHTTELVNAGYLRAQAWLADRSPILVA